MQTEAITGRTGKCGDCHTTFAAPQRGPLPLRCPPCRLLHERSLDRARYAKNPEKFRDRDRRWRELNPEKSKAASRRWKEANHSRSLEISRKWKQENAERAYAITREWYRQNRHKAYEHGRKWRELNREKVKDKRRARRALLLAAEGSFTNVEFRNLCEKTEHRCTYCGERTRLEPDHVVPLSRGGRNDIGNIRPSCRSCNASKRDKSLDEWMRQRKAA